MNFDLKEAIGHYRRQGAPGDQNALRNLLMELQDANGGAIPKHLLIPVAEGLGVKESFLLAIIRRIPRLKLADVHVLELCAGRNCSRAVELAKAAEAHRGRVELRFVPCMRQCGKGPNLRFDGRLYNGADEALLAKLLDGIGK